MSYKKYFKLKSHTNGHKLFQPMVLNDGPVLALRTTQSWNLTIEQLQASIRFLKRVVKKKNFFIIRVSPFFFITRKPRDVRMGRGKGAPSVKIFPLVPGTIIFEFKLLPQFQVSLLYRAIKFATLRLPFKTQILTKNGIFTDNFKNYW